MENLVKKKLLKPRKLQGDVFFMKKGPFVKAIRRCKEFRIFDQVIPLSIAGTQIWTLCCMLTNF